MEKLHSGSFPVSFYRSAMWVVDFTGVGLSIIKFHGPIYFLWVRWVLFLAFLWPKKRIRYHSL